MASKKDSALTAFAVVGQLGEKGLTHFTDEAKAMADLKALRGKLGLTFPVVIVPKKMSAYQASSYKSFNDAYAISKSRTILFAKGDNEVVFAETIGAKSDEQFKRLADAVTASL